MTCPEIGASPSDLKQYQVRDYDLLVCEGGEVGRAGIVRSSPPNTIIQNSLHRLRPKSSASIEFLRYVLQAVSSSGWLDVLCNKATISHFTREKLADARIPIPEIDQQHAITAFLDRETSRIDSLIAKKQRQIELLNEKRAALISRAVTKGLKPDARMKDSGVEWLGEIPEHWKVKRLKYITPEITVGIVITPAKYYENEGIPCLRSLNVKENQLLDSDLVYISAESNELLCKSQLEMGDLVLVRTGQPGTTAVVISVFITLTA